MSSRVSEQASERMSAMKRTSEVSSVEQANEWALRANEQVDGQMAQCSTHQIHILGDP